MINYKGYKGHFCTHINYYVPFVSICQASKTIYMALKQKRKVYAGSCGDKREKKGEFRRKETELKVV